MILLRLQRLAFKSYLCNLNSVPIVCFIHLPMTLTDISTPYIHLVVNFVHAITTVRQELVDNTTHAVWKFSYRNLSVQHLFYLHGLICGPRVYLVDNM